MNGKKVVIVGDELIVAEDLKHIVEAEGYKVEAIVRPGSVATEKVVKIAPDIILLDIPWEGISDFQNSGMMHKLKTEGIGFIFITAILSGDFPEIGYHPAVVIEKPFKNEEVIKALWMLENEMQGDLLTNGNEQNAGPYAKKSLTSDRENTADGK